MLLRPIAAATTTVFSIFTTTIDRHFSTTSTLPKPFSRIPWRHRSKAIQEAQKALIDYLHTTRSMPFVYAENIATRSPHSLWKIVSKIPFSPSTFSKSFQRFLRYHPVNELDIFLESIGLNLDGNGSLLCCMLAKIFFLSDCKQFDSACALAGLGFPWWKLGLLCGDDCLVLDFDKCFLRRRFNEIKDVYGFSSVNVIGICLVWPRVLVGEMDDLLKDLKIAFVDYDLAGSMDDTVDAMLDVCRKIRVFYDLGCAFGKVGELIGKSKRVLIDYSQEVLDELYANNLIKVRAKRTHFHTIGKLNFLHSIGFGENKFAVKALAQLNSSGGQLQQRFDYLLHCGIEYSNLCAMVKFANILNQQETILKQKLDFLSRDMRSSLQYLDVFPGYLCFDLEKRIKPRYEVHKWLVEEGFCEKEYSISTIVATSEKTFNARVSRICGEKVSRELIEQRLKCNLPG